MTCKTCRHKWYGSPEKLNFASWWCRKGKPVLIGSDAEMKKAKGCSAWGKP